MLDLARQAGRIAVDSGDPRLVGQAGVALETAQVVAMDVAARDQITAAITAAADPALTISESLTAVASDLTGLQVDRQVTWQEQELPSTGIQVVDNKITFTARGTFHVRAVVDGVYSPWVAVTALPKRRLASLAITDPVKVLKVTLTKGGSATVDVTQLPVVAKDQYGDPVDLASSTWVPTGTGLSVQGTTLTITAPGSYSLSLTSGAIRSNSLPVRATLVKRQLRFNTGGGTEVAPVTVPDGKIVWLGTYTTTRPGYIFTGWYADALPHDAGAQHRHDGRRHRVCRVAIGHPTKFPRSQAPTQRVGPTPVLRGDPAHDSRTWSCSFAGAPPPPRVAGYGSAALDGPDPGRTG